MSDTVVLNAQQKMQYNLHFIEQFRRKQLSIQNELRRNIQNAVACVDEINFDDDWYDKWRQVKQPRSIDTMLEHLNFYQKADDFLQSKRDEMQLLIDSFGEDLDPVKIAMHQVKHSHLLEQLEKAGESDCEELLATLERGLYMVSDEDDKFQVGPFNIGRAQARLKLF